MRFDGAYRIDGVRYLGRLKGLLGLAGLLVAALWAGPAPAADSQAIPDLHFSVIDQPGETSVRLPLASDSSLLYGMLSPYLSLGSSTPLARPLDTGLPPGLRRDTDGFDDVRMGAGLAVPLSERTQLYGEYRFLRGRLEPGAGRGLLQREPDSADFRAGFSIRLD
jgi:hypothetical protein